MCCVGGECREFVACLSVQIHPWPNTACFVFRAKELTWHVSEFFLAWRRIMDNNCENKAGKREQKAGKLVDILCCSRREFCFDQMFIMR